MKVIVTGARAPAALHLARLFHADGHAVVLADTFAFPLARATRCKLGYTRLSAPAAGLASYADAWRTLVDRHAPDLVVPTCEEIFHLAAVRDVAGIALPLFAPSLERLARVHNKYAFARLAHGFGADPPATRLLLGAEDVAAMRGMARAHVLKPVWSRFASRVLIRPTEARLAALRPTAEDPWVAQAYLPGEEICAHVVASDGVVTALQAYRPLYRAGTGAGVAFEHVEDAAVRAFVAGLTAALRWTGHISFDFKRDEQDRLRVLECNPRPTSGVHFFTRKDGLADAILGSWTRRAQQLPLGEERRPARLEPGGLQKASSWDRLVVRDALRAPHHEAIERPVAIASETRIMGLPLAMAIYGGLDAARKGRLRHWAADFRRMGDIAAWPGEGSLLPAQLLALAEIAGIALARRKSLQAASTNDIEWNGRPFA